MLHEAIFFSGLHIKNVKGLREDYYLNIVDRAGNPARWTVLLGNNNTGKTTLLRCFASMQVVRRRNNSSKVKHEFSYSIPHEFLFKKNYLYHKKETIEISVEADLFFSKIIDGKITVKQDDSESPIDQLHNFFGFHGNKGNSVSYGYKIANTSKSADDVFNLLKIYGYGTSRRIAEVILSSKEDDESGVESLFSDKTDLLNLEEWLLQLDYAKKNGSEKANKTLKKVIEIITNEIFPELSKVKFSSTENFKPKVEVLSNKTWVSINDLGYGYQATMAWLADLAKRMFDRYPDLENPLHGPAIVLVDEIDLHLHPEWQRKIIKYLSDLFPNTQFIVTAHSPLIVQSAENVNLIMLEKDDETGSINVRQQFGSFQGWTVEEILRELMDMGEKTRSDRYLELMRQFEDGLLGEDYAVVKTAYEELDKILSPSSHQRKVLQIQMSSLIPA